MELLGFSLSYIMLQAYYDAPSLFSLLLVPILLLLLGVIYWIRIKNKKADNVNITKIRHEKRIWRSALIGWLLFSMPVVACEGSLIGWNLDLFYSFLTPGLWLLAIPGALFGAIVGILLNNKEKKDESVVIKHEDSLESKIKGLKNLLDEGLLTQEEFDEQKKKMLNS